MFILKYLTRIQIACFNTNVVNVDKTRVTNTISCITNAVFTKNSITEVYFASFSFETSITLTVEFFSSGLVRTILRINTDILKINMSPGIAQ